jgi:hypothetical protein
MGIMGRLFSMFVILIILNSCVTNKPVYYSGIVTRSDLSMLEMIDVVEVSFESTRNTDKNILLETAYNQLLAVAQKRHTGKIDVMNIELKKNYSKRNLWYTVPTLLTGVSHIAAFYVSVSAKGVVVKLRESTTSP